MQAFPRGGKHACKIPFFVWSPWTTWWNAWNILEDLGGIYAGGTLEAMMRYMDIIQYAEKTNGNIAIREIT